MDIKELCIGDCVMIAGIVIVAAVLILISLDDVYKEIRGLRNDLKKYNQKK